MSEADEGLELRSGRVVAMATRTSESEGKQIVESVDELRSRVHELEQKLVMSEQAVSDKDVELQAIREALDSAKSGAATDLTLATEEAERERCKLQRAIENLEMQNRGLKENLEEYSLDFKNQEVKFELARLQGLESVRQNFDREREMYLERIQRLEKELAAEKELRSSLAGSGEGAVPSRGAAGGESHGESVETPKGVHDSESVARGSEHAEHGAASTEDTGVTSPATSKVSGADLLPRESSRVVSMGSDKITDSSKGGTPLEVGSDGTSVAAKIPVSVVSKHAPDKAISAESGHGVIPPSSTGKGEVLGASPSDGVGEASSKLDTAESSKPAIVPPESSELVQSMAKFIQAQTDMMAAQTKAMAAQSLPPLVHFSGEGSLIGEESFDRWLEHFEERAAVAGWSVDQKKYRFKMHLDKTAFQTFCMLSKETKQSYSAVVEALRKRFQPVDIEELRGAEFYQIYQKNESVEEIGIKLQAAARKAFPSLIGKEHDRLMKGRFFQSLAPRWQRKLGAPKVDESFDELFNRARTTERREQQYCEAAEERKDSQQKSKRVEKAPTQPRKEQAAKASADSEKKRDSSQSSNKRGQGPQCHNCHRFGHIAKFCWDKQKRGAEAPGKQKDSKTRLVSVDELSDRELEQELSKRRLEKEQQLASASAESSVNVVTGAVGPSYWLQVTVEGLPVSALVDTGSQSTIISRSLLHKVFKHLKENGKALPILEHPCTKFKGKGGHAIGVTAQVLFTLAVDGKSTAVPVFVQPDSEQECLLGSNVLPALGISVVRANGRKLTVSVENGVEPAHVNLVQSVIIPGQKGRFVRGQVEGNPSKMEHLLFEPKHETLEPLGLCTQESLVTVHPDGSVLIPLQNFQGMPVWLEEGSELGVARACDLPDQVSFDMSQTVDSELPHDHSRCASVKALVNSPERLQRLLKVLDMPVDKLNPVELEKLKEVLAESTDVFALDDSELGCTSLVQHSIDTGDQLPVKQQPYRTPVVYREKIEKMVNDMQEQGVVKPSNSPWASPIVLVPKKDGSLRFCVDFRRLNAITRKDVYPLPRVEDILDTLGEAKYFTSLDLASGYWKVELDQDARAKSAFTTHHGLFEFVRMPFGLCNAPATFQRLMQAVLSGLEWRSCFAYLDDILIASRTFDDHLRHLREVFGRLREAGLRLKPKKCLILRNEVPYLGHVISTQGVRPDPSKTEKVKLFPTPRDVTTIRQFVGLASYYRRFVPGFAKIAAPLHALTKKDVPFEWTSECETAFCKLKELLVTAPVLSYPRFGHDREFILETDASGIGLGAVLSQKQDDGHVHPIAYASRSLNAHEKNYGISELETLGLVWAVRYFRPYLLGHHTIVYTDHSACLSLLNTPRPSGKLARWALTIQEMNLTLKHRSGRQNVNADALSRNPASSVSSVSPPNCVSVCEESENVLAVTSEVSCKCCDSVCPVCFDCSVCSVFASLAVPDDSDVTAGESVADKESLKEVREMQLKDPDLALYIAYLECHSLPDDDRVAKRIVLESRRMEIIDGVLYREDVSNCGRWCIVVPEPWRQELLTENHSTIYAGHLSERKVYDRLRRLYWWSGMRADVRRFCRGCLNCASRKGPGHGIRPLLQPIPVRGPFHRVGVDILKLPLTSSGNQYLVVFLDYLTEWVEAYPVPDQRTETIARLLVENIVCRHGVPEELLSDRGANFLSDLILQMCSLLGMKKVNTSGYHPQTDGLVEKFNCTITNMISKSIEGTAVEWDKQLPMLLFAYRSTVQDSTQESPFYLLYGRDPRLPTASDLALPRPAYTVDLDDYKTELTTSLANARECARQQIQQSQKKQKLYYDRKSKDPESTYRVGDRVMVYMPSEVTGKNRKLARPYHGPYRIVAVTPTNAEVKLIERASEPSIFVAIDRLRKCYPELPDRCWTGRKQSRKRRSKRQTVTSPSVEPQRTTGPVTRSMTQKS